MIVKKTKLYNMILPPFMLFTITPLLWVISMVGNFIIDSAVVLILFYIFFKKMIKLEQYEKIIFRIWFLGYIADLIGAAYLLIISIQPFVRHYEAPANLKEEILSGINRAFNFSHYDSFWGMLFILSGILISAVFIFIFNYNFVFKKKMKDVLTKKQMIIASLTMAIATAPYTFLLPKELFY